MKFENYYSYLLIMVGVTYAIRAIPFVLCQNKVKNRFIQSFLAYVPYAVLGAMTFPAIFTSTGSNRISALMGTIVAFVLAYHRKSLLTVAVGACLAAFVVQLLYCM